MGEQRQLTLGSLFSGSGTFELAGLMSGVKPVWSSDIEPFPVRVTTKRLPFVKHYGNVSDINGEDIEPVDIITFGSPCFPAGTLVLTDKGFTEIESIKVGDRVLTHEGRWRKVTATGHKEAETVVLKGNHYGLECTANHPIYSLGEHVEWVPASRMEGRLWAVPNAFEALPIAEPHRENGKQNVMPPFSKELFYLVGRWLGDGWVRDGQRSGRPIGQTFGNIIICASTAEEPKLKEAVEMVTSKYSVERTSSLVKYTFCGQVLCGWLTDNFGKYACGKHIPSWAYSMDLEYRQSMFNGLIDADGNIMKNGTLRVTTISKKLAHGIRLLGETLGYSTTIFFAERPKHHIIDGREVNQRNTYTVTLTKSNTRQRRSDGKHSWYRVRHLLSTNETKTVYNLSVEEDNSYVADGVIVHNCQDMSMAGKRSGLDGSRSCLFYEAIRIIKEMRRKTDGVYPTFALWENVPGAFTSNDGDDFRAVLEALCQIVQPEVSIPRPEDGRWKYAGCIMGEGYSIAWRTLDAQYFGVPQRRRRIYLVADFNGERASEVLFKSEGVSGYSKEGFRAWQNSTRESEGGVGVSGWDRVIASRLNHGDERTNIAEDWTTMIRASEHPHIIAENIEEKELYDNHIDDARYNRPLRTAPTIISRYGTGGNNQPLVVKREDADVYRPQDSTTGQQTKNNSEESDINKNAVLMSNNATRHTVAYGLGGYKSNSMLSDNPYSGIYLASTSRTLDTSGATPACNQGGIMIVEENETAENNAATNDKTPLTTKRHTVRKLTPTECARLQGFPDWWCSDLAEENPSEDEIEFWEGVFEDNRKVVTPDAKPKTKASIKRWLQNPYSDSAEYKMWGNGMALPCAYFVMSGVVWAYNNTEEC